MSIANSLLLNFFCIYAKTANSKRTYTRALLIRRRNTRRDAPRTSSVERRRKADIALRQYKRLRALGSHSGTHKAQWHNEERYLTRNRVLSPAQAVVVGPFRGNGDGENT